MAGPGLVERGAVLALIEHREHLPRAHARAVVDQQALERAGQLELDLGLAPGA